MSRDSRSRRSPRPPSGLPPDHAAAAGVGGTGTDLGTAPRPLVSLLAEARRITDVLPHLHQHAIDATRGVCSLLLEHNPRSGALHATSGFGLDALSADPLIPGAAERTRIEAAFVTRAALLIDDASRDAPALAARLGTRAALLVPLARHDERVGLLAIGFDDARLEASIQADAAEAGGAFVTALDLFRLRESEALRRDVRDLLNQLADSLSATLTLDAGLDIFCLGVNRLFGADRTSVWIHDRRARHLVLQASSDPERVSRGVRVGT